MTLEQFWSILLKQWKLILLCFLVAGSGSFISTKLMTPVYQSSVLVQVVIRSSGSNQADYSALMASDQLVQTEATLATSTSVLRQVVSHYSGLTLSQLAAEVTASPRTSTQLFEIIVVDPSPIRAASLANDVAAALIQQQHQQIQQNNALAREQIQQNIDQTGQQINETTTKISAIPKGGDQGQLALLQTQLSGLQQRFSQWQTALAQLELTLAQVGNPLQIAQPAQPAAVPVRPNVLLNTLGGFLAGLLLGLLSALLYEKLDTRVRTPEAITQLLEWPVIATIWRVKTANREEMINPTGQNANVEAYRILRTNIGFSSIDRSLHSMLITSSAPGDGKSSIAANLAIFMAKAGKNTLLIDGDLHRPTQHLLFGLSSDKLGLSNAVLALSLPEDPRSPAYHQFFAHPSTAQTSGTLATNGVSLGPFVHSVMGIPNLWVMPSGPLPPNPAEFLESKVMQRFLALIKHSGVEIVIFDAPPLLGLSDVSILAPKVDGVLVVVDTTRATKGKLRQVRAILSQSGVQVFGCVANKVKRKRDDSTYYSYYAENQNNGEKSMKNEQVASNTVSTRLG